MKHNFCSFVVNHNFTCSLPLSLPVINFTIIKDSDSSYWVIYYNCCYMHVINFVSDYDISNFQKCYLEFSVFVHNLKDISFTSIL